MTPPADLPPLGPGAVLAVVDMQRLFAEDTAWRVPGFADILPLVARLAAARPERTLFTRFLTPASAEAAPGSWRRFYRHWPTVTLDRMDKGLLDLVPPLAALAPPGALCDKTTYSPFASGGFAGALARLRADTLVLAGVETDVCVLATAFAAVDRGLRVVVAADAVASASPAAHAAVLGEVLPRLDRQIEVTTAERVLAAWTK